MAAALVAAGDTEQAVQAYITALQYNPVIICFPLISLWVFVVRKLVVYIINLVTRMTADLSLENRGLGFESRSWRVFFSSRTNAAALQMSIKMQNFVEINSTFIINYIF